MPDHDLQVSCRLYSGFQINLQFEKSTNKVLGSNEWSFSSDDYTLHSITQILQS